MSKCPAGRIIFITKCPFVILYELNMKKQTKKKEPFCLDPPPAYFRNLFSALQLLYFSSKIIVNLLFLSYDSVFHIFYVFLHMLVSFHHSLGEGSPEQRQQTGLPLEIQVSWV